MTTIISWVRCDKVWSTGFNVKMVLLSRATGSVSSGNLSALDVISSKVRETTYQYWPRSIVSFENLAGFHRGRRAAADIVTIRNQASCSWQNCSFNVKTWKTNLVAPYSTDNRSKVPLWSNSPYPFFHIFVHNRSFLVILPNFSLHLLLFI